MVLFLQRKSETRLLKWFVDKERAGEAAMRQYSFRRSVCTGDKEQEEVSRTEMA